MPKVIEDRFSQWTQGKSLLKARISIYEMIRDIPYAIIPGLIHSERYIDILRLRKGSCTPKHFLLCAMYQRLGMTVLYAVYPFRWDELEVDYPPRLRRLAKALPTSYHLTCKVDIEERLVLVDATLDPALKRLRLPVNERWDGKSHTFLPMRPCGKEQLYHPLEAQTLQAQPDEESLAFYQELNLWLEELRKLSP